MNYLVHAVVIMHEGKPTPCVIVQFLQGEDEVELRLPVLYAGDLADGLQKAIEALPRLMDQVYGEPTPPEQEMLP